MPGNQIPRQARAAVLVEIAGGEPQAPNKSRSSINLVIAPGTLSKREMVLSKREVPAVSRDLPHDLPHLRDVEGRPRFETGASCAQATWETRMTWKTPKIVEVPVGMEINMYACASRK